MGALVSLQVGEILSGQGRTTIIKGFEQVI